MKKFLSGLLTLALLVGTIPVTNLLASEPTQEPAKFTGFDENNIAYRFAVLSDVHITYDNYNEGGITSSTRKYAAAVAQLAKISDGKLDTVMLAGDYTGTGRELPRESFAQVTDKLFTTGTYKDGTSVWADGNKPNLILAYGNHDTYQAPSGENFTSVAEHEATYNKYDSLKTTVGQDGRLLSTDGEGSYLLKDGDYYFLTVQIEHYSKWDEALQRKSNTYSLNTLKWLKDTLEKIEAGEYGTYNNGYIYIATHAPVEDTVYGSDPTFCGAAAWGSTKLNEQVTEGENVYNFNSILSEHPQVILFSGHTHMAPILETTIMSKDYTSIVVGSVTDPLVYTNIESDITYLDSDKTGAGNGYGVYVEVDINGNQKIHRLSFENTSAVEIDATCSTDTNNANLYGITLNSWTSTLDNSFEAVEAGPAWTLPAPTVDGNYLNYYSKENRNQGVVPTFKNGDVVVEKFVAGQNGATMKVTFPTATSTAEDTSVFNYKIEVCKDDGTTLYTTYALGDWYPNASGGVAAGQRKSATSLTYQLNDITAITDADDAIYVVITAMDEYGNKSVTLKSDEVMAENASTAPNFSKIGNPNLLSTMAAVHSKDDNSIDSLMPVNSINLKGIKDDGTSQSPHVNFYLDREKYNQVRSKYDASGLGGLVINSSNILPYMSDLRSEESVVYEMDVKCTQALTNTSGFRVKFRVDNGTDKYTLQMNFYKNGIYLYKQYLGGTSGWANAELTKTAEAKLNVVNDNTTQHITMLATPAEVSVWVDGELVINKFDISTHVTEKMYPVFSIEHSGANVELSNMRVYRYDSTTVIKTKEPTQTIAQKNYTDADVLTIRSNYSSYVNKTGEAFYTDNSNGAMWVYPNWDAAKDVSQYINMFLSQRGYQALMEKANNEQAQWADYWPREHRPSTEFAQYMSDFESTDTVVYTYQYNTHALYSEGNSGYKFDFRLRGTGTNTEGITASIRSDGLYIGVGGTYSKINDTIKLEAGDAWHKVTIVATPERLSLWHDGTLVVDNMLYSKVNANAPKTTYPTATYVVTNVGMIIQQTKVYNYDETVWDTVKADDSCVTNISNTFTSNLKDLRVFGFDNIINIKMANNYNPNATGSYYYWTTEVAPIGSSAFDRADSYVFSAKISLASDAAAGTKQKRVVLGSKGTHDDTTNLLAFSLYESYGVELKYNGSTIASKYVSDIQYDIGDAKTDVVDIKAIVSPTHVTLSVNNVLIADNIALSTPLTELYPYVGAGGFNMSISDVHIYYNNSYYEQAAETALAGKLAEQESYTNATWKAYQDAVNTLTEAAEMTCDKTTRNKIKLAISDHSGTYGALKQAVPGDVNGDDSIDVRDIVRYKKYIKDSSTDIRPTGADINVDTSYNKDDLDKLKDMLLGVTEE